VPGTVDRVTEAVPPPARPLRPGRVLVVASALAVAAIALVAAGLSNRTDEPATDVPSDVVALIPPPGAVAFRQDDVGAELQPYLTGTVVLDGREIPEDQLTVQDLGSAQRVTYRPGVDAQGVPKEIEELEPGRHVVEVKWWNEVQGRPNGDGHLGSYRWEFTVQ
jgi:hypothetical protein